MIAFALAEELSVPVMVCVDGFVLTHAFEPIDLPSAEQVDGFLPPYHPRQLLDPSDPVSIGAMVGPEAYTEVRYLSNYQLGQAADVFPALARRYGTGVGRTARAVEPYRTDEADTVMVTLGSVSGTAEELVDELDGNVGVLTLTMFRPFPYAEVRAALAGARRVIVLERSLAPGSGGVVTADVRAALVGSTAEISTVIAGLGGRAVSKASLRQMLADLDAGRLGAMTFLDLRRDVVEREIARLHRSRDTGPHALSILRESGVPASRIG